ncbi:unnamed protein product, partial [Closterium sp. NIES-54]
AHMDGGGISRVLPALPHWHHPHVNPLRALLLLLAQQEHLQLYLRLELFLAQQRPYMYRHIWMAMVSVVCYLLFLTGTILMWTLPLTTGAMAVYFVFLCWSAIMSEPPAEACKHSPSPDRMRRVALYS